jgi:hypothetical protein
MISGQRLIDIFTAAIVTVGLAIGGWGLAQKYAKTETENRALVAQCLSQKMTATTGAELNNCSPEDVKTAQTTKAMMDAGHKKALAGLFVVFAGGMISGTAGYARGFERRMKNTMK